MAHQNLNPKSQFLVNEVAVKVHRDTVTKGSFQHALSVALAEFSRRSPSREELIGANAFIDMFLNLGEKEDETGATFPTHRLKLPEEITAAVAEHKTSEKKPDKK
jgi:hypothetical protein